MPTILITGTSTGIGHATAELFAEKGWSVLAGSREPAKVTFAHEGIKTIELDVNDPRSIDTFFASADARELDCIVNNAGYGLLLPFEDTPREEIEKMFATNVFGLMDMSRHAARLFRERGAGTILNIASAIGRVGIPFYAAYCATKWAVEGFSESLAHELRPFNVHVKIIEPSGTRTNFHPIAYDTAKFPITDAYQQRYERKHSSHTGKGPDYDTPETIAELIYVAASDPAWRLRYSVPAVDANEKLRCELGYEAFWQRMSERLGSGK